VEATHADMDDAWPEAAAVVGGDRNPAERDLGDVVLTEADDGRSSHG
jgi:hypothetical protein